MKTEILTPSVHVAIGDKLQSNSTIFINGPDVFLVEAMAAREDAEKLRDYVEAELNKRVRFILCTNYFSDHMAALKLFPCARIDNALFYVERLREIVMAARQSSDPTESIEKTELQTCLPAGVIATDFEQAFHRRNLETIVARRLELH